jgi:CrcB protein
MLEVQAVAAVAVGGAFGAAGRFGIAEVVRVATPWPPYIGTLAANLIGCFAIGVAFTYLEGSQRPDWVKALLVTGMLGAFTTFSTFSLEAMHLIEERKMLDLGGYIFASVLAGLAACKVGMVMTAVLLRT